MRANYFCLFLFMLVAATSAFAQGHSLYGDLHVEEDKTAGAPPPLAFEIILYNAAGSSTSCCGPFLARQVIPPEGRFRFNGLANGTYEIAVVVENNEISRTRVELMGFSGTDFRQDIYLQLKSIRAANKPSAITAADLYKRPSANEKLFKKAEEATDQKHYDESIALLQQVVAADPKDFQAWAELGTVFLFQQKYDESEKAYQRSIAERPTFFLALLNLGRLRILRKNFEGAIQPLTDAVQVQPTSADANYYLGEAYLQIKKGSKGVGYLNEALKLDPIGKAQAHLLLAALYNGAGMKDKAALEYEAFLKKKPDYADRKKLEQYIAANKK